MVKWYKDLKIVNKLISAFLLIAFLGTLIGAFGIFFIFQIKNSDTELYKEDTLGLEYFGSAAVNFQQLRYNILKLLTVTTDTEIKDTLALVEEFNKATVKMLDNLKSIEMSNEVKATFDSISNSWTQYQKYLPEAVSFIKSNNLTAARPIMLNTLAPIGVTIRDEFLDLMDTISTQAESKAATNTRDAFTAIIVMAVIVVINLVLAIICALFNANVIGKPIIFATKLANMLAIGDLNLNEMTKNSDLNERKDEIGILANSFNKLIRSTLDQINSIKLIAGGDLTTDINLRSENDMLGKALAELVSSLNHLAGTIVSSSNQVAAGSDSISDSSMALSQGATEQASAVEQLTASLEEISSQTNLNAQNAEKASELAKHSKSDADKGNSMMKDMLKAMEEINASSSSINKIIKVIDDIAFQTNILALNAAVESARAGQHGRGFAVVAEEVRTLAARSANAVKETEDMILGSIKNVNSGTKIAQDTALALDSIVVEIGSAAELVGSIAVASREQALGIAQINQGIMQVSQVVQTNAATAEESAAASEELSTQAARLKEALKIFKIKKSNIIGIQDNHTAPEETFTAPEETFTAPEEMFSVPAKAVTINKHKDTAASPRPKIALSDSEFGKY